MAEQPIRQVIASRAHQTCLLIATAQVAPILMNVEVPAPMKGLQVLILHHDRMYNPAIRGLLPAVMEKAGEAARIIRAADLPVQVTAQAIAQAVLQEAILLRVPALQAAVIRQVIAQAEVAQAQVAAAVDTDVKPYSQILIYLHILHEERVSFAIT